jgi:RNA polymerase sigma-70 factor, ECF subfamily
MSEISFDPAAFTQLLNENKGDKATLERLLPVVYRELRQVANRYMHREDSNHTLQATALVHEAFVRLSTGSTEFDWKNRSHFIGVAAHLMRKILIDHARAKKAEKRGGASRLMVTLQEEVVAADESQPDLLALDMALNKLAELDPRQARIVEMRYFGGLSIEETSEALELSPATVKRDWTVARAFLHREIAKYLDGNE